MTTFGWKKKSGGGVVRKASEAFEKEAKDELLDNEVARGEVDWLTLVPKAKKSLISLEDNKAKSRRLRCEGSTLAEAERYWEAMTKWDEALLLTPKDSKILEMKAQAQMALGEAFPAVQTAQQAVSAEPNWWEAQQTLGRAQLNMGEVGLAVRSFSKAVMLNPADRELWEGDLTWACSVRDKMVAVKSKKISKVDSSSTACELLSDNADDTSSNGLADYTAASSSGFIVPGENSEQDSEETNKDREKLGQVPQNYVNLRG